MTLCLLMLVGAVWLSGLFKPSPHSRVGREYALSASFIVNVDRYLSGRDPIALEALRRSGRMNPIAEGVVAEEVDDIPRKLDPTLVFLQKGDRVRVIDDTFHTIARIANLSRPEVPEVYIPVKYLIASPSAAPSAPQPE